MGDVSSLVRSVSAIVVRISQLASHERTGSCRRSNRDSHWRLALDLVREYCPEVCLEEVSLGRVVAKPPTEGGRHAVSHTKE